MDRKSHRRIHQIRRCFLCIEAVAAVVFLPAAARFSGELLRRIGGVVLSPRFVFLLGNAIVLLVFRSSGRLLSSAAASSSGDLLSDLLDRPDPPSAEEDSREEAEDAIPIPIPIRIVEESPEIRREEEEVVVEESLEIRREEEEVVEEEESPDVLREEGDDDVAFRKTVEAFIERQLSFRRQESMEIVFSTVDAMEMVPVAE